MSFEDERRRMVDEQIAGRGIRDPSVLAAMGRVPREAFVPDDLVSNAYEDGPVPIDGGQTVSQPFVVALMIDALELGPEDRVLEVGAGSGYAAAILGQIAGRVHAVERLAELADLARDRMRALGYANVEVRHADGTLGWAERGPFDAILVSAGGPAVPASLLKQLAPAGRLVMPIGADQRSQELVRVRRIGIGRFAQHNLGPVHFVPLIGSEGWAAATAT